ncbi:MAG TPA: hypothetical protein VIL97_04320 [Thermoanaerobaculia bacterium]
MKDGEKRAKKTAKTVKKTSVKKTRPKQAAGKSKAVQKVSAKAPAKSDGKATAATAKSGKGPVVLNFTNPAVGSAFKRAVKKYSNALKRLTD